MPIKPSEKEEKYFLEQEAKRLREKAQQDQAAMAAIEKKRLKELHYLHCPKCGQQLATEKYGKVEVDVCGHCKGLWLDADELTMILESEKKTGLLHAFSKVLGA
jgi:uncharacterized protein